MKAYLLVKLKHTIVIFLFCSPFIPVFSQADSTSNKKNIIKLNFFALGMKNLSVQYERSIAKKISIAIGFRYMAEGYLPFKNTIADIADDAEVERQLNNFKTGNFAVTPEIRFYVGRKGNGRGFYIAPYGRFARYTASLLYEYDDGGVTKTIPLSGSVNTITGGLLFGAQWKLGKLFYLDWWIFGPNYGISNGTVDGKKNLNVVEQQALRNDLENLDIPLTKITYVVDANGATVKFDGPWAGIRSGLCLGLRF